MFKKLTLGRMPRVFVAMLAMDEDERTSLCEALRDALPLALPFSLETLTADLHKILQMPKIERERFAALIDMTLDDLHSQDAFGTEGQNDPRGDHRG